MRILLTSLVRIAILLVESVSDRHLLWPELPVVKKNIKWPFQNVAESKENSQKEKKIEIIRHNVYNS